jgi:hypothetical protein
LQMDRAFMKIVSSVPNAASTFIQMNTLKYGVHTCPIFTE